MNNLTGSFTLIFKKEIPDQARSMPGIEIDEERLSVFVNFASVTPRRKSIEFTVNGETYSFAQTIQQVKNGDGIIFTNTEIEETAQK